MGHPNYVNGFDPPCRSHDCQQAVLGTPNLSRSAVEHRNVINKQERISVAFPQQPRSKQDRFCYFHRKFPDCQVVRDQDPSDKWDWL